jgi:hypothetical protein
VPNAMRSFDPRRVGLECTACDETLVRSYAALPAAVHRG